MLSRRILEVQVGEKKGFFLDCFVKGAVFWGRVNVASTLAWMSGMY
jgi:hypothetical protein